MISTFAKLLDINGLLPRAARARRTTVVGCIDGLHRGQVRGWAVDMAQPTSRLVVHVADPSGAIVTSTLADRYRADVQKAGYGDGHHGFAVPASNLDAGARFFCGRLQTELSMAKPDTGKSRSLTLERATYVLHLDERLGTSGVSGWAVDRLDPGERRQLRLHADGRPPVTQRATLFRPDSIDRGGDGFHGFSFPLPPHAGHLFVDDLASGLEFQIR